MSNFFVHIGLPKTGTTFLQKAVFPKISSITYIRRRHNLRTLVRSPASRKILISDEAFSGNPLNGSWSNEFEKNVQMMQVIFNAPAIIIGFRRHESLLISLYKQYLQEGGTGTIKDLFDPFTNTGLIKRHELHFRRRLEYLDRHFQRVFVYSQEELHTNLSGFLADLATFMDVSIPQPEHLSLFERNVGLRGVRQARILRHLNRLDRGLDRAKYLPTLNGRILRKLRLTPRHLCQHRLSSLPTAPLVLSSEIKEYVSLEYEEDWMYIECRRINRLAETRLDKTDNNIHR
jgi:hypothetical protein